MKLILAAHPVPSCGDFRKACGHFCFVFKPSVDSSDFSIFSLYESYNCVLYIKYVFNKGSYLGNICYFVRSYTFIDREGHTS